MIVSFLLDFRGTLDTPVTRPLSERVSLQVLSPVGGLVSVLTVSLAAQVFHGNEIEVYFPFLPILGVILKKSLLYPRSRVFACFLLRILLF